MMRKMISLLLCAALLLPCVLSCAESAAFDESFFEGKTGYTVQEDGSWTYVRGAEMPYPGFFIAVRISVSGRKGEGPDVPRLEVGLLKSPGSDEAAAAVTGVVFYMNQKAYTYKQMEAGEPYASVPLFAQGRELAEALAKTRDLQVRVYYGSGDQSVYDISNFFKNELSAAAKDLVDANLWDALTDADGHWAETEAAFPLKITAT